ncbi:winged helix-turn-helix domain-containing protein [Actinomadura opuntiae]|uniref:winged helix-turn-helix domain-containing protein n=1 Tax=Actinomadura sp. OS1-43 TaxID=604315 RepID=UPI00255A7FAB|nr:winged helix-turn-helix domain-containing protein [Actinomadura sp. OS1-43]MDL4815387.1 winged helix-turn-helix domain-containing protein [Actinomadura sp. OS1-43]
MVGLSDPRPLREQITSLITRRIADGTYAVGSKIPTARELARECDVSERTIAEVIRGLRESGVLRGIPGRGVYVLRMPDDGDA